MSSKKPIPKAHIVRRASQILFFLILPGLFTQILTSLKSIVTGISSGTFSVQGNMFDMLLLASAILVSAFAGRFFCGWMCAFGAYGDFLAAAGKKLKIKHIEVPELLDKGLKSIKYVLLGGLVVFVWGLQIVTIPSGVNPMEAFGLIFSFGNLPDFSLLIASFLTGSILLAMISIVSLFIPRFFCRYLCPTGALLAAGSLSRILHIRKNRDACGKCTLCSYTCPMQIPLYQADKMRSGECIQCAECVNVCPRKNCRMEVNAAAAAPIAAGVVAVSSMTGLYYIGTFAADTIGSPSSAVSVSTTDGSTVSDTASSNSGAYADGTYTGSGTGFRGTTTVTVTVQNGEITDITLNSKNDDDQYFNRAWDKITALIISSQSTDVDAVSGATFSSNGIMEAVADALKGHENITISTENVTVSTSSAAAEQTTQTTAETAPAAADASQTGSADSSSASAVIAGLSDGVYSGTGTGLRGETQVDVTVKGGKITDIAVVSYQDDQEFFTRAESGVVAAILSAQDPDVDAVSGATYSSNSIMEAVASALGISYENTNSQIQQNFAGGSRH